MLTYVQLSLFQDLAEEFCKGNVEVDTFMSDYIQKRSKAYEKRAKLEKLGDLFRQGTMSTTNTPYPTNTPKPVTQTPSAGYSGAGYGMGGTPYPNNYGGMPMPAYYQR